MRSASVIIVHPSRLFAEGLQRILQAAKFKVVWFAELPAALPSRSARGPSETLFVMGSPDGAEAARSIAEALERFPDSRVVAIGNCIDVTAVTAALSAGACGYLQESMSSESLPQALSLVLAGETIVPIEFIRSLRATAAQQPRATEQAAQVLAASTAASRITTHARGASPSEAGHLRLVATTDIAEPDQGVLATEGHGAETASEGAETGDAEIDALGFRAVLKTRTLSTREGEILQCLVRGDSNKEIARNLTMAEATVKVHLKTILRKIRVKNRTQAAIWAMNNLRADADDEPHAA